MSTEGSASVNPDKTVNYAMSGVKEHGDLAVSASAFVNNYRAETDKFYPNAPQFSVVGGNVGVTHAAGHGVSLSGAHIPSYGNQVTAATNVNLLATENHRVDVNAFTTHNMPKGPTPAFNTHGGGVDYIFKDKINAGASVTRTPLFKQTDYSLNTGLNLHQTPTSSFNVGVGANRSDNQFGRGKWEPRLSFGLKKTF